jgi:protein arginine kinase activator
VRTVPAIKVSRWNSSLDWRIFWAGLTDLGKQVPEVSKTTVQCKACGLAYEDFRKFGRFGCAECYTAFKPYLKTLLKKIHGSNVHMGKKIAVPEEVSPDLSAETVAVQELPVDTIDTLRGQLHQAIETEDFELAAILRDKIREKEQQD